MSPIWSTVPDPSSAEALLANVRRLYQQLQAEGVKGGVGSGGLMSRRPTAAYLVLEQQIRTASARYRQVAG